MGRKCYQFAGSPVTESKTRGIIHPVRYFVNALYESLEAHLHCISVFRCNNMIISTMTRRAAVCIHTDRIHPISIDIFVRLVLPPIRRAEAVVSC
jgi:hypothetical protein